MAMKIVAGENVGRQDIFLIDPKELIVDESKNTRWQPHDDAAVATLVRSFKDEGQLQPCVGRRLADHRVQLVAGFRRWKAATQFNQLYPDSPMKLAVRVLIMNEEEALRRSVVENREREETTPMDDAITQRRFREEFGWTDVRIAEFYKVSAPYVGILKKLLLLPSDVQEMVHAKQLSVTAAVALTDLSAEEQKVVLTAEPVADNTPPVPVTSATVIKRTRERKIAKGGKQARSLKEVKDFLESLTGPVDPLKGFAELFLKFIQGNYTDATMEKKLKSLLVAMEVPAEVPAASEAA